MTFPLSPDDRPDPADQHAVRARVPEHVSRGVFSTGVIVMTAPTEFVIDFIQNLGRPHQVVARVIMPHPVLPQFVDALLKNIELYRGRYGNLPQPNLSGMMITNVSGITPPSQPASPAPDVQSPGVGGPASRVASNAENASPAASGMSQGGGPSSGGPLAGTTMGQAGPGQGFLPNDAPVQPNMRRATAQEIYDDLKIRDEVLSGSYANAVMIGHGPHEFSFDFITNFYPHSAVSARVFLAAGQVARLAESLRGAWDQIRHRFQQPPGSDQPPLSA